MAMLTCARPSTALLFSPPNKIHNSWASVGTDAVKHCMYIGVGVGWQRRCKTCQSLRELDNQGTLFLPVTMMAIELDHIVRGG